MVKFNYLQISNNNIEIYGCCFGISELGCHDIIGNPDYFGFYQMKNIIK